MTAIPKTRAFAVCGGVIADEGSLTLPSSHGHFFKGRRAG